MKKKISSIIVICAAVCIMAVLGYAYGKEVDKGELPIYESAAIYPAFSMPALTEKASTIVCATVVSIGETYLEEIPVSLTGNPAESSEVLYNPITPITLEIETHIKGNDTISTLIYYEEGGSTSSYIQLPDGYAMEEGMEVILFLNEKGRSWGAQSIFPVVGNEVILNKMALDYVDNDDISVLKTSQIDASVRNQISNSTVSVMDKESFLAIIEEMVND